MTGALVAIAVIAAATAFGLVRRRRDGRLRPVGGRGSAVTGSQASRPAAEAVDSASTMASASTAASTAASAAASSAAASSAAASSAAASSAASTPLDPVDDAAAAGGALLRAGDLGEALGEHATLVQFSTAFCAPCRATRRILDEVVHMVDGVVHVEIDAERHLDLVRRLNVLRTPTVLVLDRTGRVVRRASGQPRKADVIATLGQVVR